MGLRLGSEDGIIRGAVPLVWPAGRSLLAFLLPERGPYESMGRRFPPIRDYEIMFIVDPKLSDKEIETVQQRLTELTTARGGEMKKIGPWQRRRLAYAIGGRRDGIYVLAKLRANPSVVRELEQQLKVTESVLRHMVVRLDGEEGAPKG